MKFLFSLLIFAIILLCCSCKKDKNDIIQGSVIQFNLPDTLRLGEASLMEVMFSGGSDGCAKPAHLKWFISNNVLSVRAFYNYPQMPSVCFDYIPTHKLILPIVPTDIGHFFIVANDGSGVIKEVVIE